MAKTEETTLEEYEREELTPEQQQALQKANVEMSLRAEGEAVRLSDIAPQIGIPQEQVPLERFENTEITIHTAEPFRSPYQGQLYALHCCITVDGDDTLYGTTIGGVVAMEKIRKYVLAGGRNPLVVVPVRIQPKMGNEYWDLK